MWVLKCLEFGWWKGESKTKGLFFNGFAECLFLQNQVLFLPSSNMPAVLSIEKTNTPDTFLCFLTFSRRRQKCLKRIAICDLGPNCVVVLEAELGTEPDPGSFCRNWLRINVNGSGWDQIQVHPLKNGSGSASNVVLTWSRPVCNPNVISYPMLCVLAISMQYHLISMLYLDIIGSILKGADRIGGAIGPLGVRRPFHVSNDNDRNKCLAFMY